jgi:acetyl-CoA carboxylase biotin carboxyl carrier protein
MMDFDELKRILEMVREHELSEFELEREGFKLRVKKGGFVQYQGLADALQAPPAAAPSPPAQRVPVPPSDRASDLPANQPAQAEDIELAVVKSPIVGTFFAASEPGAAPFVAVGDVVKKGQVLCIIEAMKLMNEIDSEYDGEIVNVYVRNGQAVQYGERLFAIRGHRP